MAVARRPRPGARGDPVEVRRQRERGHTTAQREPRLHVESIVNSRVESRQTCFLSHGVHSRTLAGECVGEYGTKGARETGVRGRVRRVLRRREYGMDARICLWGPGPTVLVLGIEASDERGAASRAPYEQNTCGPRLRA